MIRYLLLFLLTASLFGQTTSNPRTVNLPANLSAIPIPVTPPAVRMNVILLGTTTVGDMGSGSFYWDYSSSLTPDNFDVILSNDPAYSSIGRWIRLFPIAGVSIDAIARLNGSGTNTFLYVSTYIENAQIDNANFNDGAHLLFDQRGSFFAGLTDNAASQEFVAQQTPLVVQDIAELVAIPNPPRGQYATVMTGPLSGTWQYCPDELAPDNAATLGTIRRPSSISTNATKGRWMFMFGDRHSTTVASVDALVAANPQLLTASNLSTNPLAFAGVEVQGYYEAGDGGAAIWRWDASRTGIDPGYGLVRQAAGVTTGRWVANVSFSDFSAEQYGISTNNADISVLNRTIAINAALQQISTQGGGVLSFGPGRFDITVTTNYWWGDVAIVIPINTFIAGIDNTTFSENTVLLNGGASTLRLEDDSDCDMIWFDTNGGTLRQVEVLYDGTVTNSFLHGGGLRDIVLMGNRLNQNRGDCDAIVMSGAWNIEIDRVTIKAPRGNTLWLRDVNGVKIRNCNLNNYAQGMQVWIDDSADTTLTGNYIFGGYGPMVHLNALGSFQNILTANFVGNSLTNTLQQVTDITAGVFTVSTNQQQINSGFGHNLWPGQPVFIENFGGTFPTNAYTFPSYFVARLSDTTLGLHTNQPQAILGNYLSNIEDVSGTNYITVGEPTGLLLSYSAGMNTITANRFDQNYQDSITLRRSYGNTITANLLINIDYCFECTNSLDTNVIGAGVRLRDISQLNTVTGNTMAHGHTGIFVEPNNPSNLLWPNSYVNINTNLWVDPFNNVNNYKAVEESLSNGSATIPHRLVVGEGTDTEVLHLVGGASGQSLIQMVREGLGASTNGFGVTTGGAFVREETTGLLHALWRLTGSGQIQWTGGNLAATAAARNWFITQEASTGTNIAGANMFIQASTGTGTNRTEGRIEFQTAPAGVVDGTTPQVNVTRFAVRKGGQVNFVPLPSAPTEDVGDGDVYYDSGLAKLRLRVSGVWVDLH